jgi:hypothetical protein
VPVGSARPRRRPRYLTQPERLIAGSAYIGVLLIAGRWWDGSFPTADLGGAWFTAGAAGLVLVALLAEPFDTRPADALLTGVALALAAWSLDPGGATIPADQVRAGRLAFEIYGVGLAALSAGAILLKDRADLGGEVARALTRVAGFAGRAVFVFSAVYLAATYAAFAGRPDRMFAGFALWSLIAGGQPFEHVIRAWKGRPSVSGAIRELVDPGTAIIELPVGSALEVGQRVAGGAISGVVVDRTRLFTNSSVQLALDRSARGDVGRSVALRSVASVDGLIGSVVAGSTINELRVRVTSEVTSNIGIRRLIFPLGSDDPTYYVVTGARLETDGFGDHRIGRATMDARKLGRWNEALERFVADDWVPSPGTAVVVHPLEQPSINVESVGFVPGSRFGVPISISEAVTYNTAILGILGAGKTTLAYQLIRRMIVQGVHVLVLDISRRYSVTFRDIYPPDFDDRVTAQIKAKVAAAKTPDERKQVIPDILDRFLTGDSRLLVLDPVELAQSLPIYSTPAAVTHAVAEALLRLAQNRNPDVDPSEARYCLVLEEAHTLVPEQTTTVEQPERNEVNGTVRAILQGRKYGLGCLLITQRTANVAKSILNQCNTVFAMRMYDDTGIGFLSNYVGKGYVELLPSLLQGQAVAFGSAIRNPRTEADVAYRDRTPPIPLLVSIHDDQEFKEAFWDPRFGDIPKPGRPPGAAALAVAAGDDPSSGGLATQASVDEDSIEVPVEKDPTE